MPPSAPSRWGWWQGLVAGQSLAGTCCAFTQPLPAIVSIWVETLLSIGFLPTIYHLWPQTEQDHTGLETKSIYQCFVWVALLHRPAMSKHWRIRIHEIWCLLLSCLYRLFFKNFVTFFGFCWSYTVYLCWNFSTLSDLWSRLQKWLIRVLELGRWSCKQIFLSLQCHVFSLTLAVRKQRYTKAGLVSSQLSTWIFVMAQTAKTAYGVGIHTVFSIQGGSKALGAVALLQCLLVQSLFTFVL